METQTENRTREVRVKVTKWETIEMDMPTALEFTLIPDKVREALKEWWEWYEPRYAMPITVTFDCGYIGLIVEYDITEEVDACIDACVKQAEKDGLDVGDIGPSCADTCLGEVAGDTNTVFNEVWRKLWPILDKHGLKYDWEMSWDYNVKYLRVHIKT